jgi:hypothetical protein
MILGRFDVRFIPFPLDPKDRMFLSIVTFAEDADIAFVKFLTPPALK